MSAIEQIIKWAQTLPDWQGDAVRRLLEQGELTNSDRDELYAMVKVEAGIQSECVEPAPPKIGKFSGTGTTLNPISLQRISEIQHVNAVENGSTIPFGHSGITVIYGENGCGKSSYARILKRACRARDTKESILPNIFDSKEKGPATASIKIIHGATKGIEIPWQDGDPSDDRLTSITFFDAKCARVIVDDNNEATYVPYGCEAFDGLVTLIKNIRSRLQSDKPSMAAPASADIVAGTDSDTFLLNLNRNTKTEDIDSATEWTAKDEKDLTELTATIAQSGTDALIKKAARLEATAKRATELSTSVATVISGISSTAITEINAQLSSIRSARKAAEIAAKDSLQDEPLSAGTTNEWKLLYEAARDYSVKVAYTDSAFPATDQGDLCVLCQQPLDDDARARLQRFKKFMEDKSEQTLQTELAKLVKQVENIGDLVVPKATDFENVLQELGQSERESVEDLLEILQKEQERLSKTDAVVSEVANGPAIESPKTLLSDLSDKLTKAAEKAKTDADPKTLATLVADKDLRVSRRALSRIEKDVRSYVENSALEYKYEQAIRGLSTRSVSEKSKEIISAALSPQLQGDLGNELKTLNADHLPLAVNITGREGGARHQITLDAAKKAKPSDILSEGELGVVAVAGFMAELGGAPSKSPIVLDDPVSSLDHRYSRHIAQRLVDEAEHRQVVVFTHNIAFLVEIEKRCAGVPLTVQTVRRFGTTPGKCMEGLPWEAMLVKDRLTHLDSLINDAAKHHGADDTQYNREAAYVYDLLRETWEAFIEQDILNATVRRHDTDVQTQRLMRVEIKDEDCKTIDEGVSKCSEWMAGHDKSKALSVNRPSPNEIRKDVQTLRAFSKQMKGRHEEVRKRRKAILEPQSTELG